MRPTRRMFAQRLLGMGLAAAPLAAWLTAAPANAQYALLSPEEEALVKRAIAYLDGLGEAKARFRQTDGRGQVTEGELYLKRPGKARFAYDPPSGLLVVSNGKTVFVTDSRLKTFNHYPLFATPLSLFLAKRFRFEEGVQVTRVTRFSDGFSIAARDLTKQAAGQLELTFRDNPLALAGWAVTDAQGRTTRVQLVGLRRASSLPASLFEAADPRKSAAGAKM